MTKQKESFVRVCISTYPDVLSKLDRMVEVLRQRGHKNASRSSVIRCAIQQLRIDNLPADALEDRR